MDAVAVITDSEGVAQVPDPASWGNQDADTRYITRTSSTPTSG